MPLQLRPLLAALLLLPALCAARECDVDGVDVNPDNGYTTQGKTGIMKCYDDDGTLVSEQELRDGEEIGFERRRDLWGNVHERTTNANRNTHGRAREFWPDGTLKEEAEYDDGDVVGTARHFHKNGKLARLSHSARKGEREAVVLQYDEQGRLTSLQCGQHSWLEEDRKPCGFAGKTTTTLYRHGRAAERVVYVDGLAQRREDIGERGEVTASAELDGEAQLRRSFHPDGTPASEIRVLDGYRVNERTWYMNGRLKSETKREPKHRDAAIESVQYRDDGTLALRESWIDDRRVSVTHYDEAGKVLQVEDYTAAGHLERRRKYSPDGRVSKDESFHPDGSRK